MHAHSYSLEKGQHKAFVIQLYTFGLLTLKWLLQPHSFPAGEQLDMDTTIVSDQRLLMAMWVWALRKRGVKVQTCSTIVVIVTQS